MDPHFIFTMDEISNKIIEIRKSMLQNLPVLRASISVIISHKIIDIKEIEHTLDTLLDYTMMGLGKKEFEKLNTYYQKVNADNADFYWRHYRDMLSGD